MTTTPMRRIVTTLAVGAVLAGGHPVAGNEPDAAAVRTGLTLGGQPLARLLRADPTNPGGLVQAPPARLDARSDRAGKPTERANAETQRPAQSKRRFGAGIGAGAIGAGIGAGLGALGGLAFSSLCHNEGGSRCWTAVPVLGGLAALAGYGIGKCMSLVGGKISAVGRPRPHRVNGRTALRARDNSR